MNNILSQLTSPAGLFVGGTVLLVLLLIAVLRSRQSSGEGDFLNRVRELVEKGDFRGAASLQRNHNNFKEALNLLERGRHHMDAAKLAESQGWYDRAAKSAVQAGQFEWAAELYFRSNEHVEAAKLLTRVGKHFRAAEILEQAGTDDWRLLAQVWEKALLQLLPSNQNMGQLSPDLVQKISMTAEKAADAYQRAGVPARAALIYEACQQKDKAETIRRQTMMGGFGDNPMGGADPLATLAGGGNPSMASGLGADTLLSEQSLGMLSRVVDNAVSKAISEKAPSTTQVVVSNQPITGAALSASSGSIQGPAGTQIQVIYIPDKSSNKTTAVRTESDRYEILDKLGEGGMAVVYKAIDKVLEREVALKFLPEGVTQAAASYDLFEREAKSAAGINHPNIITIYDFGQLDGRPFICMELLDGISLDDLLQKATGNKVPLNVFFQVFDDLLSALDTAHGRGLVHRDVKPSNVMVTRQGLLKLMDFGIAKEIDPEKSTMIAGTPYYMAPEQFSGKGIDHRTDVFAVGVTMYLCATGKLPFEGFMRIEPPRPPRELTHLPDSLDKVIMWCLSFEPDKRPQSSFEVLQNLRRIHRELKRDPVYSPYLLPEGKDAFIPLMEPGFFRSSNEPSMLGPKSASSIGSYTSSAELPAASIRSSNQRYSRPTGRGSQVDLPASGLRTPSQSDLPQAGRTPPGPSSPGLRMPSSPGMPTVRTPGLRTPSGRGGHIDFTRRPQDQPIPGYDLPIEDDATMMVEDEGESTMIDRSGFAPGRPNKK